MIESYTEDLAKNISLTLLPREGIDGLHVGIISLPLSHPDAHPLRFSYVRFKITTDAALIRAGVHLPLFGIFDTVDHSAYTDRFNICYELAETDAGTALQQLRQLGEQFVALDTWVRRAKRWFGLGGNR